MGPSGREDLDHFLFAEQQYLTASPKLQGKLLYTLKDHAHWVTTLALNTDFVLRTGPFDHTAKQPSSDGEGPSIFSPAYTTSLTTAPPSAVHGPRAVHRRPRQRTRTPHLRLRRSHPLPLVTLSHPDRRRRQPQRRRRRSAQKAPRTADRPPAPGFARRFQPGRTMGRECRLGQQRARVGRKDRPIRRYSPWARRSRVPSRVVGGFPTPRKRKQGQYSQSTSPHPYTRHPQVHHPRLTNDQIWDLKTYKIKTDLPGHTDEVYCVDFVADKIVSGGKDRTIKM